MLTRSLLVSTVLILLGAGEAASQVISIRTVPISQAHQFDLFPSLTRAMGGVSIAVDDSLGDLFANPAKGARIGQNSLFSSPGVYRVSNGAGAGRALPVGALFRSGRWFGGAALAIQQVDLSEQNAVAFRQPIPCATCLSGVIASAPQKGTNGNGYAYLAVGTALTNTGLSVAGSVFWAGLHGVDGVDMLYAGSAGLKQSGHTLDARVGALKEWQGGRSLSALVLHNRLASTHQALYLDPFWDPILQQVDRRERVDANLDRTNTWGVQLQYQHPLRRAGWRLGWTATSNLMSHPKLPNYQLQQVQSIPRDPGNSEAFNVGVGIAKVDRASTFGLDVVYEPIWSHTWADAAQATGTALGGTIPAGGKTIENRFRFSNAILRMGFGQELTFPSTTTAVGLKLGLAVHSINYSLAQQDHVQATARRLNEGWVEWTPTWGVSIRFPAMEIRYRGSATNGTGRPGVDNGLIVPIAEFAGGNLLVAPNGPLTLAGVRVMTHQVSISFPLR